MPLPIGWFLRYICKCEETDNFFSSYGSLIHKLIELYYRGIIQQSELSDIFLENFLLKVKGRRPSEATVQKYIKCGTDYFRNFKPFKYDMVDVEKRVDFKIDDIPFVGFIDYLGTKDGDLFIVDNKSRDLKPRSNRQNPTAKDKELDSMLKQLYLYSAAIKQEYGVFPKKLCFNCFKTGTFIEEPFNQNAYDKTIDWAKKKIEEIRKTDIFYPQIDYFQCKNLCGCRDSCCYVNN